MSIEEKLWRWYERHTYAIQTIFEIAQDLIPGGRIVFNGLKAAHALLHDREENRNQDHVEAMQQMIGQVKPDMSDLVEEIEASPEFKQAASPEQARQVLENKFGAELKDVISRISPAVSMSAQRLSISSNQTKTTHSKLITGKYELLRKLGSGGQGEVFEARDIEAAKSVAIKMLPSILTQDSNALAQLREEYHRVVDCLVHPNIVQYRSMAQDAEAGRWFLVMDYIPGSNLRKWMLEHRGQSFTLRQTADFLCPIAQALDFAHQNKIVHCDLKPENILIRGNDGKLFLSDFGLAKEIHSTLSATNYATENVSGTLPYMSPEQYQGKWPDHRADIWALGIILYEIVAGHHPFRGVSFEHFRDLICNQEPEIPLQLEQNEWQILSPMLAKDRNQRPNTCLLALQALWQDEYENQQVITTTSSSHTSSQPVILSSVYAPPSSVATRSEKRPPSKHIPRMVTEVEDSSQDQAQVQYMAQQLTPKKVHSTSSNKNNELQPGGCLRGTLALTASGTVGCLSFMAMWIISGGALMSFLGHNSETEAMVLAGIGSFIIAASIIYSIWKGIYYVKKQPK